MILIAYSAHGDNVMLPICATRNSFRDIFARVLEFAEGENIQGAAWESWPIPADADDLEAAMALYSGHRLRKFPKKTPVPRTLPSHRVPLTR